MPYNSDIKSHFQKMMRGNNQNTMVKDHICKKMCPLVEARISYIPTYSGADWRDLPNKVVKLSNGNVTETLKYTYL